MYKLLGFMSFARKFGNLSIQICPICRNNLDGTCIECAALNVEKTQCQNSAHENCDGHFINTMTKQECIIVGNACCDHYYHYHCIDRWLKNRLWCPLCNLPWIWSKHLTLTERIIATWFRSPTKILEYAIGDIDLGPKVDNMLLLHQPTLCHGTGINSINISDDKKKIIAKLFARCLDIKDIEELLAMKNKI